ncbi:hypothetical protein GCM10010455_18010 [Microbacterium esteraromaticum]
MVRRHVHVMAEYGDTFPVWDRTPGSDGGPIDPDKAGLSQQLVGDLVAWNAQWEVLVVESSGTVQERSEWEREGRSLAKRVAHEVGGGVRVTYQP